jgi:uncharacterized membrane protein
MRKGASITSAVVQFIRKFVHPLTAVERKSVIDDIVPLTVPGVDFYLLVFLSCSIATLGLITDSAAVIIGAMLLAPLMSPING